MTASKHVNATDVKQLLAVDLGWADASGVSKVGAGAWSTAFGFSSGGADYVIRVGAHIDDFRNDEAMARYRSPLLPIPDVHDVGAVPTGGDMFYCISTRAHGSPLELCVDEWPTVVEALADALEAMRVIEPPAGSKPTPWHEQLLAIDKGLLDGRLSGWRDKLTAFNTASAAYSTGLQRLKSLELGDVPLTLTHGDLINRNVHVADLKITGIFDWGCQRWGDHLFELDWFTFWSPWHPHLDVSLLEDALNRRWGQVGYQPHNAATRHQANQLQIGLDHLAYNAWIEDSSALEEVIDRMEQLALL